MMEELQDEWGNVYICYRGPEFFDGEECTIRNTTDEGLPINVDKKYHPKTKTSITIFI